MTTDYQRFNKVELFTEEDFKAVRKTIRAVQDAQTDAHDKHYNLLVNSLFGLYDGYLYENLEQDVIDVLGTESMDSLNVIIALQETCLKIRKSLVGLI